jgi:hypothetical protein
MVELKVKLAGVGVFYLPKEIREAFGRRLRIIPNYKAAVIFPEGVSYEDVLSSLEVLAADIRHRARIERERKLGGRENVKRRG